MGLLCAMLYDKAWFSKEIFNPPTLPFLQAAIYMYLVQGHMIVSANRNISIKIKINLCCTLYINEGVFKTAGWFSNEKGHP